MFTLTRKWLFCPGFAPISVLSFSVLLLFSVSVKMPTLFFVNVTPVATNNEECITRHSGQFPGLVNDPPSISVIGLDWKCLPLEALF